MQCGRQRTARRKSFLQRPRRHEAAGEKTRVQTKFPLPRNSGFRNYLHEYLGVCPCRDIFWPRQWRLRWPDLGVRLDICVLFHRHRLTGRDVIHGPNCWRAISLYIPQPFVPRKSIPHSLLGVSEFAPERYQKVLSYAAGWTSTLAWQPALAGGLYPVAIMVETLAQYHNPDFALRAWQASLLMIALGFLTVPFNTIWRAALPAFETVAFAFHFLGFLAIIIPLWILAPKNSASEVFGQVVNGGGWSNTGLSLLVGQVSVFYCMAGEIPCNSGLSVQPGSDEVIDRSRFCCSFG